MTTAEVPEPQHRTLADEIAALSADREIQRLALAEAGVHPAKVERELHRDSLKQITRLAARYGDSEELLALLGSQTPVSRPSSMQEWGERQYELSDGDDVRKRAAGDNDHEF